MVGRIKELRIDLYKRIFIKSRENIHWQHLESLYSNIYEQML